MPHKDLIKKLQKHNLILEDIVLLGAAIFAGGVHNQVFGGMWDMYEACMAAPFQMDRDPRDMDASDLAEWLCEHEYDGFLCLIARPQGNKIWAYSFYYGDSIEACVDQAINQIASNQDPF